MTTRNSKHKAEGGSVSYPISMSKVQAAWVRSHGGSKYIQSFIATDMSAACGAVENAVGAFDKFGEVFGMDIITLKSNSAAILSKNGFPTIPDVVAILSNHDGTLQVATPLGKFVIDLNRGILEGMRGEVAK